MRNKYQAIKTCVNGIEFDSRKEARRYQELQLLQRAGEILEGSVKLKLRDVVSSALTQITLYRTALNMTGEEFEEKFAAMNACFEAVKEEAAVFGQEFAKNGTMLQVDLVDRNGAQQRLLLQPRSGREVCP